MIKEEYRNQILGLIDYYDLPKLDTKAIKELLNFNSQRGLMFFPSEEEDTTIKDSLKQIGFKKFFELDLERKRNDTRNILA